MKRIHRAARHFLALLLALSIAPTAMAATGDFTVQWTAPGDDGSIGRATNYDLRYSTAAITTSNFNQATPLGGLPVPATAGTLQNYIVSGLNAGMTYYLAIRTVDEVGNWSGISNVLKKIGQTAGAGDPVSSLSLSFSNPWPNPTRSSMSCSFTLPELAMVRVEVYDLSGRLVHTLANELHEAGASEVRWNLTDPLGQTVQAGIYLLRAQLGTQTWTRRVTVVR